MIVGCLAEVANHHMEQGYAARIQSSAKARSTEHDEEREVPKWDSP